MIADFAVWPQGRPDVLPRPRLTDALVRSHPGQVTWIVGPGGSGKSSLAASFVQAIGDPVLWYTVEPEDVDPATFFSRWTSAISSQLNVDTSEVPRYAASLRRHLLTFARAYFRGVSDRIPGRFVVVLDNVDDRQEDGAFSLILRALHDVHAERCSMIVTSRQTIPSALIRDYTYRKIGLIGFDDLRLTDDEAVVLGAVLSENMVPAQCRTLNARMGGWVAGFVFSALAGDPGESPRVAGADSPLFEFLSHEVLNDYSEADRIYLAKLALARPMTPQVIEAFTDGTVDRGLLDRLVHHHCFVSKSRQTGVAFEMHPLFRELLRRYAREHLPPEAYAPALQTAVTALLASAHIEEAGQLLLEDARSGELAIFIKAHGRHLLAQSRHRTIARWAAALPDVDMDRDPDLALLVGRALLPDDPGRSRNLSELALGKFLDRRDVESAATCLCTIIDTIHQEVVSFGRMGPWIERLVDLIDRSFDELSKETQVLACARILTALNFSAPAHPEFEKWFARSGDLLAARVDLNEVVLLHTHYMMACGWRGREVLGKLALTSVQKLRDDPLVAPHIVAISHAAESNFAMHIGRWETAYRDADNALSWTQANGVSTWDALILGQSAATCLASLDRDLGQKLVAQMGERVAPAESNAYSQYLSLRAWIAFDAGQLGDAVDYWRTGNDLVRRTGVPLFMGIYTLMGFVILWTSGDRQKALACLREAHRIERRSRLTKLRWARLMFTAALSLPVGDRCAPSRRRRQAWMRMGQSYGFYSFFFFPRNLIADLCAAAHAESGVSTRTYLHEVIRRHSLPAPHVALPADGWPVPVRVTTLGDFSILANDTELKDTGKLPAVPLRLLKALIVLGGSNVSERKVASLLWPDADDSAAARSLATTLHRLRGATSTHAVDRQAGRLTISKEWVWIDALALRDRLDTHASADPIQLTDEILRLYRGRFLPGDDTEHWVLAYQDRLHLRVVEKLEALGQRLLDSGHPVQARAHFLRAIDLDESQEGFWIGAIQSCIARGRWQSAWDIAQRHVGIVAAQKGTISPLLVDLYSTIRQRMATTNPQ